MFPSTKRRKSTAGQMPIFDRQTITDYENIDSDISYYQPHNDSTYSRNLARIIVARFAQIHTCISTIESYTQSVLDDNRFTNTTPMGIQQSKDPASSPRSVTQSLSIDQRFFSPNIHTYTRTTYDRVDGLLEEERERERETGLELIH